MRLPILITAFLLAGCSKPPPVKVTLIHVPKEGCPNGSRLVNNIFREKDGSKESGCFIGTVDDEVVIDVIKSGESVLLKMLIVEPEPSQKPL